MERKWLAALLPLTMMGAVSLAANPFADVTPDDWAYQAVSELSEEGVVSGHPALVNVFWTQNLKN